MQLVAMLVLLSGTPAAIQTPAGKTYQKLVDQFEDEGGARQFAPQFLELHDKYPKDPAAIDALVWIVKNVRGRAETTRALQLLRKHHAKNEKMSEALAGVSRSRSTAAESFLDAVIEMGATKAIQAAACLKLAQWLDTEANILTQIKSEPALAPRVLQYYGKNYGNYLASLDAAKLEKRRTQVYEMMKSRFGDVETPDGKMGQLAGEALYRIRYLSVGKQGPDIDGSDVFGKAFKLSDYRGKVVMLSFWADW